MFSASRIIFASLVTLLAGILVYFHFHGAVTSVKSFAMRSVRATDVRLATGNNNYVVSAANAPAIKLPPLPDISKFTVENIAAQAPAFTPGKVSVRSMIGLPGMREFIKKDGRVQRLRLTQQAVDPRIIYIEEGHYDLTRLQEELKAQQASNAILEKQGNKHLLRVPILVGPGASLVISDKDTEELLLSQEKVVFIVNAGDLYVLKTQVTGWNEAKNTRSFYTDSTTYRPFFVTWSGGRTFIAGSKFSSLGYRKGKSYGMTFSSCEPCLEVAPNLPRPTGAIVGSMFTDLYFGFYSYEADDIAIVGNNYIDNVVYGIDPHDRSRRLIIAGNTTMGSRKKHGIILSRSVNDSWIFNNQSHHNQGSGIMLDRTSENNVIANNVTAYNEGDGIVFFESQNNTLYNNTIYKNGSGGIRIRNSWDIRMLDNKIADNGGVPIVIYTDNLEKTHKERDFHEDPYTLKAGADVFGAIIKLSDNKSAFKIDGIDRLSLSNIQILSGGSIFADHLFQDEIAIGKYIRRTDMMTNIVRETPAKTALK